MPASAGLIAAELTRLDPENAATYAANAEAAWQALLDDVGDRQETVIVDELGFLEAGGAGTMLWSWRDASGSFLRALSIEDNVMFVILSILVLIASMNIT